MPSTSYTPGAPIYMVFVGLPFNGSAVREAFIVEFKITLVIALYVFLALS